MSWFTFLPSMFNQFSLVILTLLLTTGQVYAHGSEDHSDTQPVVPKVTKGQNGNNQTAALPVLQEAPLPQVLPALGGSWSAVYDWPLVAVHAALLANGKVLAWDATPDDADDDPHTTDNYTTRVTLWDPVTVVKQVLMAHSPIATFIIPSPIPGIAPPICTHRVGTRRLRR